MNLKNMLAVCLNSPGVNGQSGVPCLIWGPPGIGKTALIDEVSKELNVPLETVVLSIREPSEVAGIPFHSNGEVKIMPPAWASRLCKEGKGIIFFDELSTAPPSVQAAALRIVLDRVVGETPLPSEVRIIAAANQTQYATGAWNLTPPLANRFCHLEWNGPSVSEWTDWLAKNKSANNVPNVPDQKRLITEMVKTKSLVSTFLTRRNAALLGPNIPEDPEKASRGWPSPRSWDMAVRLHATAKAMKINDIDLLIGVIGPGATQEFKSFETYVDLPDPLDLIQGKDKFKKDETRLDRTVVVLTSLAMFATTTPEFTNNVWKLIDKISNGTRDLAVPAVNILIKANLFSGDQALECIAEFSDLFVK